jgi:tetratricopeptide (TPR) repeat protein
VSWRAWRALLLFGACGCGAAAPPSADAVAARAAQPVAVAPRRSDVDRRLAFYQAKLAASPRHYPALAALAMAELDKAKETGDPSWLSRARDHATQSSAIQPNVAALKAAAQLASYTHRFAEALELCRQARAAYPPDTSLAALQVEALLGLGRRDDATAVLRELTEDDFYAAFAHGAIEVAAGDAAAAATAFERAAARAAAEGVVALQRFALVSAAGALLDGGDPAAARRYLDAAAPLGQGDRRLRLHQAEWLELAGRRAEALAVIEALLREHDEAELHRNAARLARQLGEARRASAHVAAARASFERALAAGEVYPLEGLAWLLLEANLELPRARALAEQNLVHKRDASARRLLAEAQRRATPSAR